MEQRNFMIRFLMKEAIKPAEVNKDQRQDIEQGRLWDAIKKAHKDVVTGARTKNIDKYCKSNCNEENKTLIALYKRVKNSEVPLCSKELINYLLNEDDSIEFGAIQKLVNMTLKYLMILNSLDKDFSVDIDEPNCDCPIDSIILAKLGPHTSWTQMGKTEYDEVQAEIRSKLQSCTETKDLGNIWFDFINW